MSKNNAEEPTYTPRTIYKANLTENINYSNKHIRRILNSLEEKGYLSIKPNPEDKRGNLFIFENKKKEFFEIDTSKTKECFEKWILNQDNEVQDYLSTDENLPNYSIISPFLSMSACPQFIGESTK